MTSQCAAGAEAMERLVECESEVRKGGGSGRRAMMEGK